MGNAPEILAPAGSPAALRAAVLCGADAVYLGRQSLNARRGAENFTTETFADAVRFCHARGVKVYLTLNTLIGDQELETAYQLIKCACAAGTDALILQDLAAVEIVRSAAPAMPMHASTQMSVQTIDGIRTLAELGFCRAVLPRELSRREIETICAKSPIELEMFVHGALCMCVSGQCYLSAMLGSRSGNRGACAQPCRLPFSADGSGSFDLSLKDLSLIDALPALAEMGIASFKIEGRMKRPEYVAAATTACRQSLSGGVDETLREDLRRVFSRTGFTDGYFADRRGPSMFGVRRKEDVTAAALILKKLETLYEKEPPRFSVEFHLTVRCGASPVLEAVCGEHRIAVTGDTPAQTAIRKPLTAESAAAQLGKTGGTPFMMGRFDCDIDENVNVPASVLNQLRRDALDALQIKIAAKPEIVCGTYAPTAVPHVSSKPQRIVCRFRSEAQIPDSLAGIDEIVLPLSAIRTRTDVSAELPRGIFGSSETILRALQALRERGVTSAWAGTLDGIALARQAGMRVSAGFGTNIFNSASLRQYAALGAEKALLSPELSVGQLRALGEALPRGIFAYGRLPLMLTRNCPVRNKFACGACGQNGKLTDRRQQQFPVECVSGCSELLNSRPIVLSDRPDAAEDADFLYFHFTTETKAEAERVLNDYRSGIPPQGDFTRGLLFRGVK